MESEPLFLIDSFAQIYRGYHAVRFLSSPDGTPTNAVFAMAKFLLKLHKDYSSHSGAFVFDKGKPAFRMELAPDYKANRPPMPEDLRAQIPIIRELVQAFGWNIIEHEGYEADDLIGSIALGLRDFPVRIFSGDKDISQIIDERVVMLVPNPAGAVSIRGTAEVQEKFGVPPSAIPDYLALIGDSSDNIPGIAGIGPKTASALLTQFGSGKNMYDHLDEISRETLRKKLEGTREQFERNLKLVTLDLNPPENQTWNADDFIRKTPDWNKVRSIAEKLALRSILKEIDEIAPVTEADLFAAPPKEPEKAPEPEQMTQMDLF